MSIGENKAVFLSYASQDAEAARRICEALRAAGVEVWFDQSELRGGDSWDANIRKQIKECALFVPVISANTQARREGYFRIEWKLAAQRTHAIAEGTPLLLPVVLHEIAEPAALVPAEFREVQWTRLTDGPVVGAFCARVNSLLAGEVEKQPGAARSTGLAETHAHPVKRPGRRLAVTAVAVTAAIAAGVWQPWRRGTGANAGASPEIARIRQLADQGSASREDLALAMSMARRLTTEQPQNAAAWSWLSIAQSLQKLRGYEGSTATSAEARRAAEHALSIDRQSTDGALAMGLHLAASVAGGADVQAAETFLQRAASSANPDLVHIGLAILYREAWRLDDVARECETVLARNPQHQLAAYYLGGVRAWQRRPEEGERLRAMASSAGGLLGIRATVGWAYNRFTSTGDLTDMRRILDTLDPTARLDARAAVASWHAAYWARNGDEAVRALGAIADAFILDNYFYGPKATLAGLAHRIAGRTDVARAQFDEAERVTRQRLGQEPTDAMVRIRLAQALALQNRAEDARRELQAIEPEIAARPPSLDRVMQRGIIGRVHAALGDADAVLPYVRELLLEPNVNAYTPKSFAMDPDWDRVRDDRRVQAIVREASAARATAPDERARAESKSVAVLAFRQLSADPDNEYLCEAISDELCSVLGRVPGLKVAASASAFTFKTRKDVRPSQIGGQLGVTYLVNGSVQKIGSRMRVRAELIKAADESRVWSSDTLEYEVKDVFALQDKIAETIARFLQIELVGAPRPAKPVNPEAYRLTLQARKAWNLRTPERLSEAEAWLQQALGLDSEFAPAHAALADVWLVRATSYLGGAARAELLTRARHEAELSARLDGTLVEARATLGLVQGYEGNDALAERTLHEAVAMNPNYAQARHWYALVLERKGRLDLGIAELEEAVRLDPFSPHARNMLGISYAWAHRWADALEQARRAVDLNAKSALLRGNLGVALLGLRRKEEAWRAVEPAWQTIPDAGLSPGIAYVAAQTGHPEIAEKILQTIAAQSDEVPFNRVLILIGLGRREEALQLLAATASKSRAELGLALYATELDPLRDDPRFEAALREVGLAQNYKIARETLARLWAAPPR